MTPERWAQVTRVFDLVVDAHPDARRRVLEANCAHDVELRREVLELLAADERSGDVLHGLGATAQELLQSSAGPPIAVGDVLGGRYRVDRILDTGGMGVIAEATHLGLQERVAMKVLLRNVAANPKLRERFLQEARAVASVRNRHIVRVRDIDIAEDGTPFMVMDLLAGVDLSTVLAQRKRLSSAEAVSLILQACEALAVVHGAGLVHRDLKPGNLFLENDDDGVPQLKLLDFGVSKQTLGIESLTKSGDVIGTLAYMSPEQLSSSRKVDARSDIWSLGVVLYELVCGHRPFNGRSDGDLCLAIMQHDAAAISESSVAPEVRAALQRCLQKDRARRYPDVVELAAQLAPVAGGPGHVQAARVARAATGTAAPLGPTLRMDAPRQDVTEPMLPELGFVLPTRRRWLLPLMILVVLGVIGVVALVLANRP
ncbi:MAG: serine/threonine protein kinase [Myxococcales bacterium]|nr:serine/threonine protein kinase [Myxococcales bacterium]MCB9582081.1 serine/threonine protein kinase [Polyangiaceae bacterium]